MPYLGNIPATQFAELKYQDFTGGTGTSFTLNDPVGSAQELEVFVNNVRQEPGVAYTVSGTALTMTGSIVATDDFYVVFQGKSTGTATHPAGQALTATDGTFTGDLTVDTNTLYVDSTNNEVGIGTLTPGGSLEVYKAGTSEVLIGTDNGGTAQLSLYENNDGTKEGLLKYDGTNNRIHLATSGAPNALVIPRDSGNVGIGTSSPDNPLHLATTDTAKDMIKMSNGTQDFRFGVNNSSAPYLFTYSGHGMRFGTNSSERMRIESGGDILFGKTASGIDSPGMIFNDEGASNFSLAITSTNDPVLFINRQQADGTLVQFRHANTTEGSITVSGTTVSYNGGHLSRWSQLTDGTEDTTIVKGTVMTNLDQMAVWSHDEVLWTADDELPDGVSVGDVRTAAYTEDNEQLNCMAVSSVEGDANVAGVFVNWDNDDDDFNDMNVAMTGDMVIRIASGTTVARGDLLMSAGDGTAKPQDDDIVRSKTIAKVTSTTVSHTYDDGSYLVPCVLMAC